MQQLRVTKGNIAQSSQQCAIIIPELTQNIGMNRSYSVLLTQFYYSHFFPSLKKDFAGIAITLLFSYAS